MKKVFVFCIGGTGIRVMKSITMLMAGGMDTNGYMVVPVIIDPHLDLEEKKNLHSLLDSYINIYQQSINNGTSTLNHLDGFFNSEIRSSLKPSAFIACVINISLASSKTKS